MNRYRRDKGIISVDDKQNVVVERLLDLNRSLTAAEAQRIGPEAQVRTIRGRNSDELPEVLNSGVISSLKSEPWFNELGYAQQAAERCGTLHHPDIVKGDVEHLLPKLARHYGEPYADDSAVPSFFVSAVARRHVTVALNGDGGDELQGGYPGYWLRTSAMRLSNLLGRLSPPRFLADLAPRLLAAKSLHERAVRKLLMQYVNPELRPIIMFAAFWNDSERRDLMPGGRRELCLSGGAVG